MSGYLDVKFPSRSARGFNPFKTWKKQWCILRPSPTDTQGGVLAMHSSCHVSANTSIRLLPECTVSRTKSRTHSYAFGIFLPGEYHKPHLLLAGCSELEANTWIHKIRAVVNGKKHFGRDIFKDKYTVTITNSTFNDNSDSSSICTLTLTPQGIRIVATNSDQEMFVGWKEITDVRLDGDDKDKTCVLVSNSESGGTSTGMEVRLVSSSAGELVRAVREGRASSCLAAARRLSRSDGDLNCTGTGHDTLDSGQRISWNSSGLSQGSVDDASIPSLAKPDTTVNSNSSEETPQPADGTRCISHLSKFTTHFVDSLSDRRSLASIASGIYEEIPDLPEPEDRDEVDSALCKRGMAIHVEENPYESVADCIYATMRRTGKRYAPPLPPRVPLSALKLNPAWSSPPTPDTAVDTSVTRHISLTEIQNCFSSKPGEFLSGTKTLPKPEKPKPGFNVFRKRIKSESRATSIEKTEPRLKDKTDSENKKKKIDFASTSKSKDLFKNLKSKNFMKNFKLSSGNLAKIGETKSCEFLDSEQAPVQTNRCSKSVECLEQSRLDAESKCDTSLSTCCSSYTDDGQDLSIIYKENNDDDNLSLPPDIVELILRGRDDLAKLRLRHMEAAENDYMPMSPVTMSQPIEQHYTVMHSPAARTPCPTTN